MESLIAVFRMDELSVETRIEVIKKLGKAINDEHSMNITQPIVAELISILETKEQPNK